MKVVRLGSFFIVVLLVISYHQLQARKTVSDARIIPDDIAFCIADLKYTDNQVKILEFGGGQRSGFKGHERLYGVSKIWELFWKYLSQFKLPMWDIDKKSLFADSNKGGMKVFSSLHGNRAYDPKDLILKARHSRDWSHKQEKSPSEYRAFLISRMKIALFADVQNVLKRRLPGLIIVGDTTNKYVFNKYKTNALFQDADLKNFRPACKVCKKKYTPELAQSIINELNAPIYVIKPIDAAHGYGVIFSSKHELDMILQLILNHNKTLRNITNLDSSYRYWSRDQNDSFIVEEYVPSKMVVVNNKPYDPTMRVAFTMHLLDDTVHITILGAYWKLPSKPLTASGTLSELHKSNIHRGESDRSAPVSDADMNNISSIMKAMLEKVYRKMLREQGKLP